MKSFLKLWRKWSYFKKLWQKLFQSDSNVKNLFVSKFGIYLFQTAPEILKSDILFQNATMQMFEVCPYRIVLSVIFQCSKQ